MLEGQSEVKFWLLGKVEFQYPNKHPKSPDAWFQGEKKNKNLFILSKR